MLEPHGCRLRLGSCHGSHAPDSIQRPERKTLRAGHLTPSPHRLALASQCLLTCPLRLATQRARRAEAADCVSVAILGYRNRLTFVLSMVASPI
jgi:hypothetical protein